MQFYNKEGKNYPKVGQEKNILKTTLVDQIVQSD